MRKILIALGLILSTQANAQVIVGYPTYAQPVYVAPPPVIVVEPQPVIVQPAPVVVAPTPVCHWEANGGFFNWNYVWVCR